MNKKGAMAQLIGVFVIILMAIAVIPIIAKQVGELQMSSESNFTYYGDQSFTSMITILPYIAGAIVLAIVIFMVINILRSVGIGSRGVDGVDDSDDEDEDSDNEYEDDDSDEDEEESEEDEPVSEPKKKHTTMVITKKKDGKVKTNVTLNPTGYNVDKYELDKIPDSKLSYKEENFKKTKFD